MPFCPTCRRLKKWLKKILGQFIYDFFEAVVVVVIGLGIGYLIYLWLSLTYTT